MSEIADRLRSALADRYAIEREIGAGGMATVYLAHDIKHDRKVAVKILRPELSAILGAERFLVEIRTTANLQHPHILALHDSGEADGTVFYVMPYIEGESLRDRLQRERQLPVDEALQITKDVAEALDYAHRQGVVHRDIKPENILLHDGRAMVADFGIALAASRSDGGSRMTETGMSLGTPHYMAPEQAMGEREITAKADVYALGCVLYELLTGEPPFTGPTAQAIVARVMTEGPRGLALQRRTIPKHVEAAVMTALEKLPADRFASAAQLAKALDDTGYQGTVPTAMVAGTAKPWSRDGRTLVLGVVAIIGLTGAAVGLAMREPAPERPVVRFEVVSPTSGAFPVVTPDGRRVIWGTQDGVLYERSLDGLTTSRFGDSLPGMAFAGSFSPSGDELLVGVFPRGSGMPSVRGIPLGGGPSRLVADSTFMGFYGPGEAIYYSIFGSNPRLVRIPALGGVPEVVAQLSDTSFAFFMAPIPGGKGLVGALQSQTGGNNRLAAFDMDGEVWKVLGPGEAPVQFVEPGYLVYSNEQFIMAGPFDRKRLEFTQPPVPVVELQSRNLWFSIGGGTLAYMDSPRSDERPVLRSRAGLDSVLSDIPEGIRYQSPRVSPEGTRVVMTGVPDRGTFDEQDLYVYQLPGGPMTRLAGDSTDQGPSWMTDSRWLSFVRGRRNDTLFRRPWDGSGAPEAAFVVADSGREISRVEWLDDGRRGITTMFGGPTSSDVVLFSLDTASVRTLAGGPSSQGSPALSPDGKWLAYVSRETGQPEVYVQPLEGIGRRQITRLGGTSPRWAHSGRELFFLNNDTLYSARLRVGEVVEAESITALWSLPCCPGYDILPGDSLFVTMAAPGNRAPEAERVVVVLNFIEELRRRFEK